MPQQDAFAERHGFLRSDVTLANWREPPFNRWAFQNLRELVPSAAITTSPRPAAGTAAHLPADAVDVRGTSETVESFLERSRTDIFLALKAGRPAAWWHAPEAEPEAPHLLFSVSKSLTALVAGILAGDGLLDLEGSIAAVMPELEGSAYADATVRDLLDMRVSLDFEEVYTDTAGGYARYRRATLWNPPTGQVPETLRTFLLSLRKGAGDHGGPFRYRSPNSDLLGLVLESAAGQRIPALLRDRLMEPAGAGGESYVTVDAGGTARTAGGILTTARDLAVIGELMRCGGAREGRQVIPEAFVRDTLGGGRREAWAAGDLVSLFPEGAYRNKWYITGKPSGSFTGIGIHGQWLHVNPRQGTTIVKFSSQAQAVDLELDLDTIAFLEGISHIL